MLDLGQSLLNSTLNKVLQRRHCRLEVVLTCVRWFAAYSLSHRHIVETAPIEIPHKHRRAGPSGGTGLQGQDQSHLFTLKQAKIFPFKTAIKR